MVDLIFLFIFLPCFSADAQIDFRTHRPEKLMHMKEVAQCTLCHSERAPRDLNLLDGTLISFSDSSKLCGQCHGIRLNEWEQGIHGKQQGGWKYSSTQTPKISCVSCHDPHAPKFPFMVPIAAPKQHGFLIRKKEISNE
jgi:hypothetical protein